MVYAYLNDNKKYGFLYTIFILIFAFLTLTVGQAEAVEMSGEILEAGSDDISWNATNCGFMFADPNDYTSWTEKLYYENSEEGASGPLGVDNENTIDEGELIYSTSPYFLLYGLTWNEGILVGDKAGYTPLPLFGEFFVAVDSDATTYAPLIFEYYYADQETTLAVGESFDLGSGYVITCNQIDVEGNKVWISLSKDGEELESAIIDTTTKEGSVFVATDDFAGHDDAIYFTTYVEALFQGTSDSFVKLKYIWLIDKDDIRYITTEDTVGVFECTKAEADEIIFKNENAISLKQDNSFKWTAITYLTDNMYLFASAEDMAGEGKYYIYPAIGVSIEDEESELAEEDLITDEESSEDLMLMNETSEEGNDIVESDSHEDSNSNTDPVTVKKASGFGIALAVLGIFLAIGYIRKR